MIEITISDNYTAEKSYILTVIFKHFLGLDILITLDDVTDYVIVLNDKKKIKIRDEFFGSLHGSSYLNVKNIPRSVAYVKNQFSEKSLPVIYGTDELITTENEITCGIDIFASSFFMLTRWEEYVNQVRDVFNRFPAKASLAYNEGFLDRPVVNEYVEMLWNMLKYLGIKQERKQRNFEMMLTHDVDFTYRWDNPQRFLRIVAGDLLKRRSLREAMTTFSSYYSVKRGTTRDPFDNFDWLMDLSEKRNIQSRFYFMSGGETKFDNHYNIYSEKTTEIIKNIKKRGHIIGFHPSFNTYNNADLWKYEKEKLENVLQSPITEGRQHYLRFEAPITWQIWEDNNMVLDCTVGYADKEGFRCGCCYPFPVFDVISRKTLKLMEYPLIVMEGTFVTYQSIEPRNMFDKVLKLMRTVKEYNGTFVFLWHNSSFNSPTYAEYQYIYEEILRQY